MIVRDRAASVAVIVSTMLTGCGGVGDVETARAEVREPGCSRHCVVVEPSAGPPGTRFTFHGHGWRPGVPVEATYGPFGSSADIGISTRFRAGPDGRFVFRFRHGPARLPGDSASGAGPPLFEQWRGRAYRSDLIRRRPRYEVTAREPQTIGSPDHR